MAATGPDGASADQEARNPITGIAGCCARAASGRATAAPGTDVEDASSNSDVRQVQHPLRDRPEESDALDGGAPPFRGASVEPTFQRLRVQDHS